MAIGQTAFIGRNRQARNNWMQHNWIGSWQQIVEQGMFSPEVSWFLEESLKEGCSPSVGVVWGKVQVLEEREKPD